MPDSTYPPASDEPIYHEVCLWMDQQRRALAGRPDWPTTDPDAADDDPERTASHFLLPDDLFGPWEVHKRHLEMCAGAERDRNG